MPSAHPPKIPSHLPQWPNQWQWRHHSLLPFKVGALLARSAVLFATSTFMTLLSLTVSWHPGLVRPIHFPVWHIHFPTWECLCALFPFLFPEMAALVILHVPTFPPALLGASRVPAPCFICHFDVKSQCPASSPEAAAFQVGASMMLPLAQWFSTHGDFAPSRKIWHCLSGAIFGFHNLVGGDFCCHLGRGQGCYYPSTSTVANLTRKNYVAQNINSVKVEKPWLYFASTLSQEAHKEKAAALGSSVHFILYNKHPKIWRCGIEEF